MMLVLASLSSLSSLSSRSLSNRVTRPLISQLECLCGPFVSSRRFSSKKFRRSQHSKKQKQNPPRPKPKSFQDVPPLYTALTSSPNAYVAICACEERNISPKGLFTDSKIPHSFRYSTFDFCHPSRFPNHELPTYNIPEVAFLGRSNVGKSSLVNSIMGSNLARCSKTPGRTQVVNYFPMIPRNRIIKDRWEPHMAQGFIVDLPGYGYANAPVTAMTDWQARTQDYLLNRRNHGTLQRVFILIDARRGSTQIDRDIMGWLDVAEISYSVIITKADRVTKAQVVRYANDICMRYHSQMFGGEESSGSQGPVVHVTSASDNLGILEMKCTVDAEFVSYYSSRKEDNRVPVQKEDEDDILLGDEDYNEGDQHQHRRHSQYDDDNYMSSDSEDDEHLGFPEYDAGKEWDEGEGDEESEDE